MRTKPFTLVHGLPSVPQHFITQLKNLPLSEQSEQGNIYDGYRQLTEWNGISGDAPRLTRREFTHEFEQWVKDNITPQFQNCGVFQCFPVNGVGYTGAHTDKTRNYVLIFNVQSGGKDAELAFWHEDGQEVRRTRGTFVGSTKNLTSIGKFRAPENQWYLIDALVLHSIENISEVRLNFQISFDQVLPEFLLEKI